MKVLPPKTEIFENFELIDTNKTDKKGTEKVQEPINFRNFSQQPSFDFMDELKAKLDSRVKELEKVDDIVYKEFDGKSFKEISKKERDIKESQLKKAIKKIED